MEAALIAAHWLIVAAIVALWVAILRPHWGKR